MTCFSVLEGGLRRAALVGAVALGFLIWNGALGATPASAAKLTTHIYGDIGYPAQFAGTGFGEVIETTDAHLTDCFYPNDQNITSCDAFYGFGWTVELRADPAPGWNFDHWVEGYGDLVRCEDGTAANVCRFTMWFFDQQVGAYFSDTTPPETTVDSAPGAAISASSAHFTFHSPDNSPWDPVGFSCTETDLDSGAAGLTFPCDGGTFDWPFGRDGHYRLSIVGRDGTGNSDPTPAVVNFTADTAAPDTSIDSGPTGTIWQRSASFAFSGSDGSGTGVAKFQCRLDGGSWGDNCASPAGYDGLTQGPHEFDVRAVDAAGNVDPTPAAGTWTVSTPKCLGQYATIVGTSGNDVLTGTPVNDVIVGLAGNDTITGLDGSDLVCGGDGKDTLRGNAGADQMDGGAGIDTADYRKAPAGVTVSLLKPGSAAGGEGADSSLLSIETVVGSQYADTLIGNAAANTLVGNGGDDTLSAGDGNDVLAGGKGADSFDGGRGTDTLDYRNAPSAETVDLGTSPGTARGGEGTDASIVSIETVYGSAYADTIKGSTRPESLYGFAGADAIAGSGGADILRGGAGDDTLYARDLLADVVDGGDGSGDRAQVDSGIDAVKSVETLLP